MSYIGSTPTTQSFTSGTDYFNGTGSQTAFTLSRTVNSVNDVEVLVNNVEQQPNSTYTISGTTLTFTTAPSSGTNNIYVRYLSTVTQSIAPSQNTVQYSSLNSDNQSKLGIMYKNRIINSNMVIDQRNGGAAVSSSYFGYVVDRWNLSQSTTGKLIAQQNAGSITPPAGFSNYLGVTSQSAFSIGSGDYYTWNQPIEGFNTADLAWGTANAKTVTLSFWVYSSLTGTFGGSLMNSATTYSYPFSYSIPTANTWTQISITITGATSGTWVGATNGIGINLIFGMGVGSGYSGTAGAWASGNYKSATGATSVVGTSGATFYITGVQLEVGTQATQFTTAGGSYGAELALCQRYFEVVSMNGLGGSSSTTAVGFGCSYKVQKRATPTVVNASSTAALYSFYRPGLGSGDPSSVSISSDLGDAYNFNITLANFTGLSNNQAWVGRYSGLFNASAEL